MAPQGATLKNNSPTLYACAATVALVATIFCAVVSILMATTFLQNQSADPLDTPALQTLKEQIQQQPDDSDLTEQIRALDLLVRRAYFSSLTALRVGAFLLLIGLTVLIAALHIMHALRSGITRPAPKADGITSHTLANSRLAITLTTVLLIALAASIAIHLSRAPVTQDPSINDTPPPTPQPSATQQPPPWPNFRGLNGLGVAHDVTPPINWDGESGSNIIWKQEVPRPGFSSPIVANDQIYLTGGDSNVCEVFAFAARDGQLLWRHPATGIANAPDGPQKVTADTGYAAATMTTDGEQVYAIFANGNILALSPDGKRTWARNYGAPENPYGHASSLLVHNGMLFIQFDDDTGGRLLALHTESGDIAWNIKRDVLPCWASPILVEHNGHRELILNGNTIVAGYDPATGTELWQFDCMGGEVAVSPAWWDGTLLVANEYAKLSAIRLDTPPQQLWEQFDDLPDVSSPVAWSNRLYMANSYGGITCLKISDGTQLWQHEYNSGFYSSPIIAANRIYLTDTDGVTRIIAAKEPFTELANPALGEPSTATPAFVGCRIYMRGNKHLFCIGVQ